MAGNCSPAVEVCSGRDTIPDPQENKVSGPCHQCRVRRSQPGVPAGECNVITT